MPTKTAQLTILVQELLSLAGEAVHLADQYAGGESETADELGKELENLERKFRLIK